MDTTDATQQVSWRDFYQDPFPSLKATDRVSTPCGACAGTGQYSGPTYIRDSEGRPFCFHCGGVGSHSRLVSSARATARAHAKAVVEHIDTVRAITARRAEFEEAHPGLRDRLTEAHLSLREGNPLRTRLGVILDALEDVAGTLTDAEVAEAHELLEQYEQELAARRPVPTGRVVLQGEIISTRLDDTKWGSVVKILLQGSGWRVWGSKPSEISDAGRGDVIEFTATVSASDDDESFGFFARPTKAHLIATSIRRTA